MKYTENTQDLNNRIRAHKLFSKMTLENIVALSMERLGPAPLVLDMGCGNGNYFELLSSKASIYIGLDVNQELLLEFSEKYKGKKILIKSSMDEMPAFAGESFDAIYSIYSIYYTENPKDLITNLQRILSDNGRLVVLGPGRASHAPEISSFLNSGLSEHVSRANNKNARIHNFHNEIVPLITKTFPATIESEIDTSLLFPNAEEWAKYVVATPETREHFSDHPIDVLMNMARSFSEMHSCLTVSKSTLSVEATKSAWP